MVRGSSQSQTSQTPATRPGTAPPRGSAAATASLRRRSGSGSGSGSRSTGGSSSFSGSAGNNSNMLRFYTDDAPGMKISPTVVLVLSLCFIGFVATLHVAGKLYLHRSGPAGT